MQTARVAVVGLLAMFALTAMAQDKSERRERRYDEQIHQQVTDELRKKDRFHGIAAAVEDGIVTLTGTVDLQPRESGRQDGGRCRTSHGAGRQASL